MRKACYKDLMEKYENPMEHACDIEEGQVFITNGWCKPVGMCDSAWESMSPFVMTLAYGGKDIYNGWMKNEKSAMISCNDGFRPVSFLIEALEEEADSCTGLLTESFILYLLIYSYIYSYILIKI